MRPHVHAIPVPALGSGPKTKALVVFGREHNGLSNEELALCTHIIQIPTTKEFSSLNLAQAVMVCCYEIFVATEAYEAPVEKSAPASSQLRERMFEIWRRTLLDVGFMKDDKSEHMMLGLRRVFARGVETEDDAHILMGVARQALWAAHNGAVREPQGNNVENG